MAIDDVLINLSNLQHGVFTAADARQAGVTAEHLRHRLARGRVEWLSPTVLRWRGAPISDEQRAMAAVLDAGPDAMLSHWSAALQWGLPVARPDRVHVVAPGRAGRNGLTIGLVHEPRSAVGLHRTELDRIPISTPARMLFDIANLTGVSHSRIERLVDASLARGLTTVPRLQSTLRDLARRGRRGIVVMRHLIEERAGGLRPTESGLEFRFHELASRAGVRGFERQLDIGEGDDWIGRMDFVHRRFGIVVECDSALHHGTLSDRRRDQARRDRLRADGWWVEAFTDVDIFHRSDEVVARLHSVVRRARAQLQRIAG